VKAVLLVGGEGTRLRPLTYTTPKQLLPVVEVPMLERVLGQLWAHGVDEAVLSLGYRPDAFLDAYPDGEAAGVRLTYAVEPEPLDTAGAIAFAARGAGLDDTFLVVNGDVLTDLDVGELVDFHGRHGALGTIALTPVDDPTSFGVVPTDDDGRVIAFVEKPRPDEVKTNLINAGTYVLDGRVLALIPSGRRCSVERQTFPALVADGALYALASDRYWLDTGTPQAYLQANADLLHGVRGLPPAPGAHEMAAGIWRTNTAAIRGTLVPHTLVGDRARVDEGARVADSVIGASAVVEAGAVVEGSVLLPGSRVGPGATVQRSVLGSRAVVGVGARVVGVSVVGDDVVIPAYAHLHGARVPDGPPCA
jgi:NDP-sugar pyrophosphorylase family protein